MQVDAGGSYTCAVLGGGNVRCWGSNRYGALGNGRLDPIGDDETPASAGDVDVGGSVAFVATGEEHACALLETGGVRCWGLNNHGQLGYGHTRNIGDDELPSTAGDVNVGGRVVHIAAGTLHTCAVLETGSLRCWGDNSSGQLGYGHNESIGDDETPASAGDVDVGGTVLEVVGGDSHTCALLDSGSIRCWGASYYGQLGYGDLLTIGDDESPAAAGDVPIGGRAIDLAGDDSSTCVVLDTAAVRCWGHGTSGDLGYGNRETIGDDETVASVGDVDLGSPARAIAKGIGHTCAILEAGSVRCWGNGIDGRLGYGTDVGRIGDDETPASAGLVDVGDVVTQLVANDTHTCALLETGAVRCWGAGGAALGYGHTESIGDDESPADAGDVPIAG